MPDVRPGLRGANPAASAPARGKWHLAEMVIDMNGGQHYLWRAADQHRTCLGLLVTRHRDTHAARKFLRKLLKYTEH